MNKPLDYIFPNPPQGLSPQDLDPQRVPEHVAIIMDGNGRWAKKRMLNRLKGHSAGVSAVREIVRCASDVGVRYLTLYSFSSENWRRPQEEVTGLMNLFAKTAVAEIAELDKENVRTNLIGHLDVLPEKTREALLESQEKTKNNEGMTLTIAVNYGGRQEILDAAQRYADERVRRALAVGADVARAYAAEAGVSRTIASGTEGMVQDILDEQRFECYLATAGMPDPDLLIRTSGEMRISNFLLWQIAYSEIYCTDVLWPDFDRYEFLKALLDYQGRQRRFGAL